VLKNSLQEISTAKFVRKLLNIRSPWTLKFTEITALVPFQQPQAIALRTPSMRAIAILRQPRLALRCKPRPHIKM
jgi:hypothetical protein